MLDAFEELVRELIDIAVQHRGLVQVMLGHVPDVMGQEPVVRLLGQAELLVKVLLLRETRGASARRVDTNAFILVNSLTGLMLGVARGLPPSVTADDVAAQIGSSSARSSSTEAASRDTRRRPRRRDDADGAFEVGLRQALAELGPIEATAPDPYQALSVVGEGCCYEATRLLGPAGFTAMALAFGGELLVTAPAYDTLVVGYDCNPMASTTFAIVARQAMGDASMLLAALVFAARRVVRGGRFSGSR
ncbi:MAG: hypothetical protein U0235_35230 [Polyangiaceae bacterium]